MDNFFHSPSSAYTITSSPFKFQGFGQIPQGARLHSYSQLPLPSVHLVPDFEREEVFLVALWAQTAKEGQVLLELGAAAELLSAHSKVGPNWKVGYWEQEVPDIGTKLQFLEAHNSSIWPLLTIVRRINAHTYWEIWILLPRCAIHLGKAAAIVGQPIHEHSLPRIMWKI